MKSTHIQLWLGGAAIALLTLAGAVTVYANSNEIAQPSSSGNSTILSESSSSDGEVGPAITTISSQSEIDLARHLKSIKAKMYGAFWCPHCHTQKQILGKEAFDKIDYIECDSKGKNGRPDICKAANIKGFPTWEINNKLYPGLRSLEELAKLSRYEGDRNFKTPLPER